MNSLEDRLGYHFKSAELLETALTHRSYANESATAVAHNERLEFLGDAIVDLVATHMLMEQMAEANEGLLSQARAKVVSEAALARAAESIGLGSVLRLGRGEDRSGGRGKPSLLADALEAVVGALYLDAGFETTRSIVFSLLAPLMKDALGNTVVDAKSRLQEWAQAKGEILRYAVLTEEGPDHAKIFEVAVSLFGKELARGRGRSKKEAEQQAAEVGFRSLSSEK